MTTATIFAGFGGQGVLLMGYVLAQGAMHKGVNVTYFPAYGAEMRGGTANCTVTVSERPIASPVASRPDFLVAMNNPSLSKFESRIKPGGIIFLDESLVSEEVQRKDVTVVRVPLKDLAREIGADRQANMVMIGVFTSKTGLLTVQETQLGMEAALRGKEKFFPANRAAIERGAQYSLRASQSG
jgi:2-oxoglutarate ferredoxin oxidoreductase subunit gamma